MHTKQDRAQQVLVHQEGKDHVQRLDYIDSIMTRLLIEVSRI
jgi:hypothetical protein